MSHFQSSVYKKEAQLLQQQVRSECLQLKKTVNLDEFPYE